ncbi:MAG: hypothetical protein II752_00115 [Muribaculaceae bacterium]|nr:hypothetical protein [Muribaculaceae bacterium]
MKTASIVLGIIALVLAILPFISAWWLLLSWLVWILAILGIVFGVVALVKKQDKGIGLAINVVAIVLYFFSAKAAATEAANALASGEGNALIEELNKATEDLDKAAINLDDAAAATEEAAAAEEAAAEEAPAAE